MVPLQHHQGFSQEQKFGVKTNSMAQTSKNGVETPKVWRRQGQKNDVDLRHTAPLGKTLSITSVLSERSAIEASCSV
ncbi:MAG: hypothetical protein EZS28_002629 [Streblomastix strix]|uniref:Uncharacterized protein n=1 Tax=Streblomastix strix TaxID=222440 RepID=A0A5J4X514_9EUKA|nr:MAG: hypothetical protein EZS28_002629 [Streblomastix strix]